MPEMISSATASASLVRRNSRRRSVRHLRTSQGQPCGFALLILGKDDHLAEVRNVSSDGVGLLFDELLPIRVFGVVKLFTLTGEHYCTRLVYLVHRTAQPQGGYLVGCEFGTPLSAQELQSVLSAASLHDWPEPPRAA